ncbi:hypothetical protein PybrP1_004116 [[Pythium] brassicae (nom. inval.)]|nr:hypothetical protein PybrP1_004116 [[Pythium] brassicae (nom. inval.)]
MFMNDSSFEDDSGRRPAKRGSQADAVSDAVESLSFDDKRSSGGRAFGSAPHPNSLKDDEEIESIVGGDDFVSGARTSVIQQQRDLQKKKLQERMGGGVVRTSLPKQYSAPRSLDVDDKPSRFGRDDDEDEDVLPARRGSSGTSRGSSRGYAGEPSYARRGADDDDDDGDERKPRRTSDYRDRGRDADYDRDYERSRERGGSSGRGTSERESARGGRGDYDRSDRDRERDRGGRDHDRGYDRSDRGRDRDRSRERERDRGDRDAVSKGRPNTSSDRGGSVSRDKDDYGERRRGSKDFDASPAKPDKFASKRTSARDDGDDGDRRSRSGASKTANARERSRSRSRSRSPSRSRSRSASPGVSSDDERDDNAATSHDPTSAAAAKPRGAVVKKPKLDMADMKAFVLRPIPKAYDVLECYIERNKSGANKMFPEYCLYMKEGDRFLLTAKKRPKNRTSNYLVSMQRGDLSRRGSDNYVGKLRANFLGTEFAIYDNGVNPKDADTQTITSNPAGIRQELGISMYAANVLGHRGPRKMKVCVPRVREDGTRVVWRPLTKEDEMINKCKEQDHTNLTYLINKPPRWNDQVCAYVLNFNGRVTMASVKNFQLVTPEDQETVVLQFGRVGKDLFTMDFRWPLCPLQAFAITLSSFDSKLACE